MVFLLSFSPHHNGTTLVPKKWLAILLGSKISRHEPQPIEIVQKLISSNRGGFCENYEGARSYSHFLLAVKRLFFPLNLLKPWNHWMDLGVFNCLRWSQLVRPGESSLAHFFGNRGNSIKTPVKRQRTAGNIRKLIWSDRTVTWTLLAQRRERVFGFWVLRVEADFCLKMFVFTSTS